MAPDMYHGKKIVQIGLKIPEEMDRDIAALASLKGMEKQELIRKLIAEFIEGHKEMYRVLTDIFGHLESLNK